MKSSVIFDNLKPKEAFKRKKRKYSGLSFSYTNVGKT